MLSVFRGAMIDTWPSAFLIADLDTVATATIVLDAWNVLGNRIALNSRSQFFQNTVASYTGSAPSVVVPIAL
jgi:hypothetical protein